MVLRRIGRGILSQLEIGERVVVVTSEGLKTLYGEDHIIIANDKSQATYEKIHKELFQRGCGRDTTLVALGGGTILDVAGFAASTYMRGIPLVLIPTTLLAMVDASIGGKTGIDTPLGKNLVGSFYVPELVITDFDLLGTLPKEEQINGFFEVLKMGLIYDPFLFGQEISDPILTRAIEAKGEIVEKDPKEKGLRRILNFGHTIGHGLEKIGKGLPHGRAVGLGCIAEAHLSMHHGYLDKGCFEKIEMFYHQFSLKLPLGYSRGNLREKMGFDKKKKGGLLRTVLIDKIGHAVPFSGEYCFPLLEKDLVYTLDYLEKNYEN